MSDVIRLLSDLVALPSITPGAAAPDGVLSGEARVVDHLEALFRAAAIDCVRQPVLPGRENLLVRVEGRSPDAIILEAHMDTVITDGVAGDPFAPVQRDGRLYGRGACDDKASLAAMVQALLQTAQRGTPALTCILVAACDEEFGFTGVRGFTNRPGDIGLDPARLANCMACVGEPTGLDVVIAHKGAYRWRIRTRGQAAHSSEPARGHNAIYDMARVVAAFEAYATALSARPRHPLVGGPTCSVGTIHGGIAVNTVPDTCEILVDCRLVPGENLPTVAAELRAVALSASPCELEVVLEDEPLETPAESPIVRRATAAAEAVLGHATIAGVQYGTDASKLDAVGIPAIVCGPGSIEQAHTTNEWVEIAQVEAAVAIYEHLLTAS